MVGIALSLVLGSQGGAASSVDLDRVVTLNTMTWPVKRIAAEIGEAAGFAIEIRSPIDRNTVTVQVAGMRAGTLLDRLSKALSCSWKVEGKKVVLFRTGDQEKELAGDSEAMVVAALQESVNKIPDTEITASAAQTLVAEAASYESRYEAFGTDANLRAGLEALQLRMPAGRSIGAALRSLNLSELARMRRGQRTVFASQPNRSQRELKGSGEILRDFNKGRDLVRQAMGGDSAKLSSFNPYDPRYLQYALPQQATRVLFAVHRRARGVSAEITFSDSAGNILSRHFTFLIDEPVNNPIQLARAVVRRPADHATLASIYSSGGGASPERQQLGPWLADPDRLDWQEWASGSTVRAYAREVKQNVVAVFSDAALWRPAPAGMRAELSSEELAGLMVKNWYLTEVKAPDCLIFRPVQPLVAEAQNLDRTLVKNLLSKLQSDGRVRLRSAAEYATLAKSEQAGLGVEQRLVSALSPHGSYSLDWEMVGPMLFPVEKFVGALSESQWNGTYSVDELSQPARNALQEWLFNGIIRLQFVEDKFSIERPLGTLQRTEITEALPAGLPGGMSMSFHSSAVPMIYAKDSNTLLAPESATFLVDPEYPVQVEVDNVEGLVYELEIKIPGGLVVPVRIYEAPRPTERKWKQIRDLPSAVLEVLRKELKKQSELSAPFNSGRSVPPPR